MKKKYIIAIIIGVILLLGLILVLTLGKDKGKPDKDNAGNDVIVHESDDDTVEEKAEGGLKESDSEDGPVLDEDTMIDFNGGDNKDEGNDTSSGNQGDNSKPNDKPSDDKPSDSTENGDGGNNEGEEPSEGEEEEEDSKDTGAWGAFY